MREKDSWDLFMDKVDRKTDLFFKRAERFTMIVFTKAKKYGFKNALIMEIEKRKRMNAFK